jgi:hypothetical protein
MGFVRSCLEEARAAGALAPGLEVDVAATMVLGALLAVAHTDLGATFATGDALPDRVWPAIERFLRGVARSRRRRSAGARAPHEKGG